MRFESRPGPDVSGDAECFREGDRLSCGLSEFRVSTTAESPPGETDEGEACEPGEAEYLKADAAEGKASKAAVGNSNVGIYETESDDPSEAAASVARFRAEAKEEDTNGVGILGGIDVADSSGAGGSKVQLVACGLNVAGRPWTVTDGRSLLCPKESLCTSIHLLWAFSGLKFVPVLSSRYSDTRDQRAGFRTYASL